MEDPKGGFRLTVQTLKIYLEVGRVAECVLVFGE